MRIPATESNLNSPGILDSKATYSRLDPTGLRSRLRSLPEHCREAWQQTREFTPPESWSSIERVVIGGMGGSAIAGDLVADLVALQHSIPVTVVRDFSFPFAVNENTLFIACSHSGSTEETLSLFHQAKNQSASILAITGGAPLSEETSSKNLPILTINAPGEPRSAVGYNLMLLLGALSTGGMIEMDSSLVESAIVALQLKISQLLEEVPAEDNLAKQIAQDLSGKLTVVYGGGLFTGMARRWKTQLNENAKSWAFFETLPELLHNSVEAYNALHNANRDMMVLVLRPNTENKDLQSRYRVIRSLLKTRKIPHRIVEADEGSPLAQTLYMLTLGDYVSYYTAMLNAVDPSPIPVITQGKEFLHPE